MFGLPPVVAGESRASVPETPRRRVGNMRRSAANVGSTQYEASRACAVALGVEVTQVSPRVPRFSSAPLFSALVAQSPLFTARELRSLGDADELEDEASQETSWLGQPRSPLVVPEPPLLPADGDLVATKLEPSDGEESPDPARIPLPSLVQNNDPFAETRAEVAALSQKLQEDVKNLVDTYTRAVNALMQPPAGRLPAVPLGVPAQLPPPIASNIEVLMPERVVALPGALPELMFPHVAAMALDEDTGMIFTTLRGVHFSGSLAGKMLGRTAVDVKKWFTAYHQPLTTAGMWTFVTRENGCSIEKHPVPTDPAALVVFENALFKLGMSKESYEETLIPSEPRKYKAGRKSRTGETPSQFSQGDLALGASLSPVESGSGLVSQSPYMTAQQPPLSLAPARPSASSSSTGAAPVPRAGGRPSPY